MANQIKLKRGLQKNLPSNLSEGEVVITTDTNKLYSKNGLLGSNVEVSTTEPSNSGVDVWLNPSGSTGTGDLQSQIDVLNNKLSVLQNIEVKACTLADGVTGEVTAYRFGGNIIYIVGFVILGSVRTGAWNPICTIPFPPKYTNRTTDFSIENNANDIATHARITLDGMLSVYPTTTTLSGSGSTDVLFFVTHFYY